MTSAEISKRETSRTRSGPSLIDTSDLWLDHARGVFIGGSDHRKDGIALGY